MGTIKVKDEFINSQELKERVSARIEKIEKSREQVITKEDLDNGISGQELIAAVWKRIDNFADKK